MGVLEGLGIGEVLWWKFRWEMRSAIAQRGSLESLTVSLITLSKSGVFLVEEWRLFGQEKTLV